MLLVQSKTMKCNFATCLHRSRSTNLAGTSSSSSTRFVGTSDVSNMSSGQGDSSQSRDANKKPEAAAGNSSTSASDANALLGSEQGTTTNATSGAQSGSVSNVSMLGAAAGSFICCSAQVLSVGCVAVHVHNAQCTVHSTQPSDSHHLFLSLSY